MNRKKNNTLIIFFTLFVNYELLILILIIYFLIQLNFLITKIILQLLIFN